MLMDLIFVVLVYFGIGVIGAGVGVLIVLVKYLYKMFKIDADMKITNKMVFSNFAANRNIRKWMKQPVVMRVMLWPISYWITFTSMMDEIDLVEEIVLRIRDKATT